jgi:hypothetical protein
MATPEKKFSANPRLTDANSFYAAACNGLFRRLLQICNSRFMKRKLAPAAKPVSVELTYRDGSVSEIKSFRR